MEKVNNNEDRALIEKYYQGFITKKYGVHNLIKRVGSEKEDILLFLIKNKVSTLNDFIFRYLYKLSFNKRKVLLEEMNITEYNLLWEYTKGKCPSKLHVDLYVGLFLSSSLDVRKFSYEQIFMSYIQGDDNAINIQGFLKKDVNFESLIQKHLNERQRFILLNRLKGKTLNWIAEKLELTKERVHQIENKACRILRSVLRDYISFEKNGEYYISKKELYEIRERNYKDNHKNLEVLKNPVDTLNFSFRTYNCLMRGGLLTIQDLTNKSTEELLQIRNMGLKSVYEVKSKLKSLGLHLKDAEIATLKHKREEEDKKDVKSTPIENLNLSTNVYNVLRRNGVYTVEAISGYSAEDIYKFYGMGRRGMSELIDKLREFNISLESAPKFSSTESLREYLQKKNINTQ